MAIGIARMPVGHAPLRAVRTVGVGRRTQPEWMLRARHLARPLGRQLPAGAEGEQPGSGRGRSGREPAERSSDEAGITIYMAVARNRRRDCTDAEGRVHPADPAAGRNEGARDRTGLSRSPRTARAAIALVAAGLLSLAGGDRLLLAVPAELGMALAEERSAGQVVDDLTIRIALNHAFFSEDADLRGAASFSVVEGRELLTGVVASPEARARAIELAGRAAGVREVIDELHVGQAQGIAVHAQDAWFTVQLTLSCSISMCRTSTTTSGRSTASCT